MNLILNELQEYLFLVAIGCVPALIFCIFHYWMSEIEE
jgi:hypothetical protein